MHKTFYASGFIYHAPSQKILLQQLNTDNDICLALFQSSSPSGADPLIVFQKLIEQVLGVSIPTAKIHPIYDYVHDHLGEHFIFYAELTDANPKTYPAQKPVDWYLLSKLSKFKMNEQTRHDIVVGERVIRSNYESIHPTLKPAHH